MIALSNHASRSIRSIALILLTTFLCQSTSAGELIFENVAALALLQNCKTDCPARSMQYLESKGYDCHDDHSANAIRCNENTSKTSAHIDKKAFKNLLGHTVYLRITFELDAPYNHSIEQIKSQYFPTWNHKETLPPEHTYINTDSITTQRDNLLRTVVFGQAKGATQSITNVTLAVTSTN